jgi:hypothetical protein
MMNVIKLKLVIKMFWEFSSVLLFAPSLIAHLIQLVLLTAIKEVANVWQGTQEIQMIATDAELNDLTNVQRTLIVPSQKCASNNKECSNVFQFAIVFDVVHLQFVLLTTI